MYSIVSVNFIDRGNPSTRRKPMSCHKSLTNFDHINVESTTPCHKEGSITQILVMIDTG